MTNCVDEKFLCFRLSLHNITYTIFLILSFSTVEFSLEAQETVDGKWHIPAADGVTWLCMGDLTRPLSLSSSSSSTLSLPSSPNSTTATTTTTSDDGHVDNDEDDNDDEVAVNKMNHRMPPSQYSAPSFKRKYFNALNPLVFDDILHPSDLPTNYPGLESSTVNPTVSSTVSSPPSKLESTSTSTTTTNSQSNSDSESSIHSSRSAMESADNIAHSPVENVP